MRYSFVFPDKRRRPTFEARGKARLVSLCPYPIKWEQRMARLEEIESAHGADIFTPSSIIIQNLPEDFVLAALSRLEALYART